MLPGLKKAFTLTGLCFLMAHCASKKQGSMPSQDKSKAIKSSSLSTASLKKKVTQKSKFSGLVNPKKYDEKRTEKNNNSSFFMDKNPGKSVTRSIEKPKSTSGGLLQDTAKIETSFKSKPKDLNLDTEPNIPKPEKAYSPPKIKRKVSDQSNYRESNPPLSPNFEKRSSAGNPKILKSGEEVHEVNKPAPEHRAGVAEAEKSGIQALGSSESASQVKISVSSPKKHIALKAPAKKSGDSNETGLSDYLADQSFTERTGFTGGWKGEALVTKTGEETQSNPRTPSYVNDLSHLKAYLNRNTALFEDDRGGQMNSLQRVEHWNEGRQGREINLSDQGGDGPRFQEALRWIQQKGR